VLGFLSAIDIAFAMNAVMQGVFCAIWLVGSWVFGDVRRAALHWSAFAGFSTLSFLAVIMALHQQVSLPAEHLRALGNLFGLAAMLSLHRGVRLFVSAPLPNGAHALAFIIVLVVSWLGLTPEHAALRVSVNAIVLAAIALSIAADLYRYGRDVVRQRHTWLLALPLVAAAVGFASWGVRALWLAQSLAPAMISDNSVSLVSAIAFMVIALTFHATLFGLVFGRIILDLRYRSHHDGLTGLLNRRAMEEVLLAQMQRSRRTGEPFTLLMLDLDHFKAVNDCHGHAAGDRALKHTAAALKAELRELDAVSRFGGEEFLVLMPGATVDTAFPVAERLRTALISHPPSIDGATVLLSASIGIAQWREPAEELSRLLMRADAALYQAKLRGRDCVAVDSLDNESIAHLDRASLPRAEQPTFDGGLVAALRDKPRDAFGLLSWRVNTAAIVALVSMSGVAWGATIYQAGSMDDMAMGLGQIGYRIDGAMGVVEFLSMWSTMMAAMMLPTIVPMVLSHHAAALRRRESPLSTPAFVVGYMLVWSAIGVAVWTAYWAVERWGADAGHSEWPVILAGAVLVFAGAYQFTPWKQRWAGICRSPQTFVLIHSSSHGMRHPLWTGLMHGAYCLGCCCAAMLVLVVVGLTNIPAMAMLFVLFFLEKNWKHGRAVATAAGIGMIVLGVTVLAYPPVLAAISN